MTRLEYTKFRHKNFLYIPLHKESLAVVSCNVALNGSINLIVEVMILYAISKRLVTNNCQLTIIIPAGTYSTEQFNQNMKDPIKGKGDMWVAAQINDDYKLVIP